MRASVPSEMQPLPLLPSGSSRWRWLQRVWRPLLFLAGSAALVILVRSVGPAAVLRTLLAAGAWFPLILALEFMWVLVEGGGLVVLYGNEFRRIPGRTLARAFFAHLATLLALPVGRAGAEVARATILAQHVGGGRATAASTLMQALTLLANTVISFFCAIVALAVTGTFELPTLLAINGTATLALGGAMMLVMRHAKVGGFLGRRFHRLAEMGPAIDGYLAESRGRHLLAFTFCVLARVVQTVQYGVMVVAITASFSATKMVIAEGIHLVGAGLGDTVPNQVGVTEGAFRFFASVLDLGSEPEKAVSIALLARLAVLTAAGLGALILTWLPAATAPSPVAPSQDASPSS